MTVIRPNSVAGINSITVQSGNSLSVHKANGELIRTLTSSSGVSTFSTLSVGTATTDNSAAKSINIGLGASISQHNDNALTFGTNGDPRITIDAAGDFNVGTAATIKAGGNATFSGIVTATSFKGDGSGLSGISAGTSLSGSTDNTICTVTGANAIQGETNLKFDGSALSYSSGGSERFNLAHTSGGVVSLKNPSNAALHFGTNDTERVRILANGDVGINTSVINRADAGRPCIQFDYGGNDGSEGLEIRLSNSTLNGNAATDNAAITYIGQNLGITNRENGVITFRNNGSERLRITATGRIGIGTDSPDHQFEVTQAGSSVATSRNGNSPQLLFKANNVGQAAQVDVNESSGGGVFILKSKNTSGSLTERVTVTTEGIVEIDGHFCAGNPGNFGGVSSTQGSRILGQQGSHPACLSFDAGGSPTLELGSASGEAIIGSNSHQSSPINFKSGMGIATLSGGTTRFQINSNGNIGAPTGSNIYNASDERLKENMIDITDGLSKIEKLKPISFTWKEGWDANLEGKTEYGFGAQTTQAVDELLVQPFSLDDAELNGEIIKNPLRVNEKYIIPLLVKAVQELSAKVAALEGG